MQLLGGLSNQMFQYAADRKIAYINNTSLKFDISCFKNYKNRKYDLGCFNIVENFATGKEIYLYRRFRNRRGSGRIYRVLDKIIPYHKRRYIIERHFHYDPDISRISGNVYLEGYWQSEKYFEDIESIIRKEFKIKHKLDSVNKKMGHQISSLLSVSIHIRRGDYVTNPVIKKFHGICSLEYYYDAIKKIAKIVKKPHFFIFSDDIKWAQGNLNISHPVTFITHNNADRHFEDLRLLSFCKHHIIANSSFSWWGAWVSTNPDKIVIAPKKWFTDVGRNTNDLIPESWHRI